MDRWTSLWSQGSYHILNSVMNYRLYRFFASPFELRTRRRSSITRPGIIDRVSDAPSLEQRMDDVRAIMDAIGSQRATLFGHSEGCAMSALFAAASPERVAKLILFGGYVSRRDLNIAEIVEQRVKFWGTRCNAETCRSKPDSGPGRGCPVFPSSNGFRPVREPSVPYDVEFADRCQFYPSDGTRSDTRAS